MEEWEGDDTRSLKHEPVAYLATAGLDSLVYFGIAMGAAPAHLPTQHTMCAT